VNLLFVSPLLRARAQLRELEFHTRTQRNLAKSGRVDISEGKLFVPDK
jgi:hypothetical protein